MKQAPHKALHRWYVKHGFQGGAADFGELGRELGEAVVAGKADVNDLRESPALEIAKCIESMGFEHQLIVEPYINAIPEDFDHYMSKLVDLESALAIADIIVLLVDHKQFLNIDVLSVPNKLFIDTRGILNKRKWLQK